MSVKVIRKQSGQANEVTDAVIASIIKYAVSDHVMAGFTTVERAKDFLKAEAASIADQKGEIERIECDSTLGKVSGDYATIVPHSDYITIEGDNGKHILIEQSNLIPLAEALLELGKQMKGAV